METSLRPKIRPSEEGNGGHRSRTCAKRANRLKKLIEEEAEGLRDKTPVKPIRKGKFVSRSQDGSKEEHNSLLLAATFDTT